MRKLSLLNIIIALIIIIIILGGYWLVRTGRISSKGLVLDTQTSSQNYQAVFLTNGQVYFGKLKEGSSDHLELGDIYYLQVQQSIQPPKPEDTPTENTDGQQPKLTLVKLGNEIHGPTDVMYINRQHVLFWEDLKETGRIVEAIKKDKESKQ
jgi:hypothetical protein